MKVLFRRTPKAALVALNKTINDCDTYVKSLLALFSNHSIY